MYNHVLYALFSPNFTSVSADRTLLPRRSSAAFLMAIYHPDYIPPAISSKSSAVLSRALVLGASSTMTTDGLKEGSVEASVAGGF